MSIFPQKINIISMNTFLIKTVYVHIYVYIQRIMYIIIIITKLPRRPVFNVSQFFNRVR